MKWAAFVVALVLSALIICAWLWKAKSDYDSHRIYKPNTNTEETRYFCIKIPLLINTCEAEEKNAATEAKRSVDDLRAQQEMADWTFGALVVSIFSLVFSAIGLGFLLWSLRQTREALEISRNVGIADTRSYVSVVGGGYVLNRGSFCGWVDVVNNGNSPALNPKITVSIRLETAWFGTSFLPSKPYSSGEVEPTVEGKDSIHPRETSRFYFSWTKEQLGSIFSLMNNERNTTVITCILESETIYEGVLDGSEWQLTNHPGFIRVTEKSLISEGQLYPRQLQES